MAALSMVAVKGLPMVAVKGLPYGCPEHGSCKRFALWLP
jgi:hypothetical protein